MGHRSQQAELGTRGAAYPLHTANGSFTLRPTVRPEPCQPVLFHLIKFVFSHFWLKRVSFGNVSLKFRYYCPFTLQFDISILEDPPASHRQGQQQDKEAEKTALQSFDLFQQSTTSVAFNCSARCRTIHFLYAQYTFCCFNVA